MEVRVESLSNGEQPHTLPVYDPLVNAETPMDCDSTLREVHTMKEASPTARAEDTTYCDVSHSQSPWERLYQDSVEREARRVQAHESAEADRVTRALFDQSLFPVVGSGAHGATASSRESSRAFVARQEEWQQEREARTQQRREAAARDELRGLQPPAINAISERIALHTGHEGPIRGWDTHVARYALRKAAAPPVPMPMFQPNININARSGEAGAGEVGERLYNAYEERMERIRTLTERLRRDELMDPLTGNPFFHPHAMWNTKKKEKRTASEAAEKLYAVAQAMRERQAGIAARAKEEHSFTPELTLRSRRIAARHKLRAEKKGLSSEQTTADPVSSSSPREEKKFKLNEFLARGDLLLVRRQRHTEERERDALREEQQNCTFTPRINRRSMRIFEQSQQRIHSLSSAPNDYHTGGHGAQAQLYHTPLHTQEEEEEEEEEELQYSEAQESMYQMKGQSDMKGSLRNERVLATGDSPSSFINSAPQFAQSHAAVAQESEGTQLISEFEERMNELIAEWRSLES